MEKYVKPGKFDVLITNYYGLTPCLATFKKIKWHCVVIDEAHKIKNDLS